VDDVDVETFPTLLIGQGARVLLGAAAAAACGAGAAGGVFYRWRAGHAQLLPEATPLLQRVTAALA
jgi:hypothetical protein